MADKTGIEWTDATWNPIRGCTRVSEGCRNCYAEGVAYRFSGTGQAYQGLVQVGADGKPRRRWNGQIRFVEEHLLDPLRWKTPRRIFVNSMSDLFHEGVTDEQLDQIFAVMALCPQHTFQVLTKRPERMLAYLQQVSDERDMQRWLQNVDQFARVMKWTDWPEPEWPLSNVWLGVSVEDQKTADERIPLLLQTSAAVRFISAEPLLGPIELTEMVNTSCRFNPLPPGYEKAVHFGLDALRGSRNCVLANCDGYWEEDGSIPKLDWVICGGESGSGAEIRPMHPDWAGNLRDQCVATGVPFFFKQWGNWCPQRSDVVSRERVWVNAAGGMRFNGQMSADVCMDRVSKNVAGDLLDGVQWHQFPEVRA